MIDEAEKNSVNENQTPRDGSSGTLRAAQGDGVAGLLSELRETIEYIRNNQAYAEALRIIAELRARNTQPTSVELPGSVSKTTTLTAEYWDKQEADSQVRFLRSFHAVKAEGGDVIAVAAESTAHWNRMYRELKSEVTARASTSDVFENPDRDKSLVPEIESSEPSLPAAEGMPEKGVDTSRCINCEEPIGVFHRISMLERCYEGHLYLEEAADTYARVHPRSKGGEGETANTDAQLAEDTAWIYSKTQTASRDLAIARIKERLITARYRTPSQVESESAWRPIESAPKDGRNFLACSEASSVFYAHWANGVVDSSDWTDDTGYRARYATLWRPLPPPPDAATQATSGLPSQDVPESQRPETDYTPLVEIDANGNVVPVTRVTTPVVEENQK